MLTTSAEGPEAHHQPSSFLLRTIDHRLPRTKATRRCRRNVLGQVRLHRRRHQYRQHRSRHHSTWRRSRSIHRRLQGHRLPAVQRRGYGWHHQECRQGPSSASSLLSELDRSYRWASLPMSGQFRSLYPLTCAIALPPLPSRADTGSAAHANRLSLRSQRKSALLDIEQGRRDAGKGHETTAQGCRYSDRRERDLCDRCVVFAFFLSQCEAESLVQALSRRTSSVSPASDRSRSVHDVTCRADPSTSPSDCFLPSSAPTAALAFTRRSTRDTSTAFENGSLLCGSSPLSLTALACLHAGELHLYIEELVDCTPLSCNFTIALFILREHSESRSVGEKESTLVLSRPSKERMSCSNDGALWQ